RYGLLIGRSRNGHNTLLIVSSRQCRSRAIGSSAGCHIAACESPTSATVVGDDVSPDTQSGCATSRQDNTHPLTNTSGFAIALSAGVRLAGTGPGSVDFATAANT